MQAVRTVQSELQSATCERAAALAKRSEESTSTGAGTAFGQHMPVSLPAAFLQRCRRLPTYCQGLSVKVYPSRGLYSVHPHC